MSVIRYPLPGLQSLKISNYDLYKCPIDISFSKQVLIVFGANGLGKSTLLHIIQYAVIGSYKESVKMRNYKGAQRIKRPLYSSEFFQSRMNECRKDASVEISFNIGKYLFKVTHSLYDDTLLSVSINDSALGGEIHTYRKYEDMNYALQNKNSADAGTDNELLKTLIHAYHDALVSATGLPDIESFIAMLTECIFFTENRDFTFWNNDLTNMIISKYFMDRIRYKAFAAQQQKVKQYDSQQRLKTYEISFIKKFLNSDDVCEDKKYTFDDYKRIQDEIHAAEVSITRLQKRIKAYNDDKTDIKRMTESVRNQIIDLDAAWYGAVFLNSYQKAYDQYSQSILSGICPFCGNEGTLSISADECFYCRHGINATNDADLKGIERKKKELEVKLSIAKQNYEKIQKSLDSCYTALDECESELTKKNSLRYEIEKCLNDDSDENYKKLKILEDEQKDFKKLAVEAQKKADEMLKSLDKQVLEAFKEYSGVFLKYVRSFFNNRYETDLELVSDKDDKMFVFHLDNKRRENSDSLSESQRIFVDFAFRLSVLEFFHISSYFMCETPDSTLDAISETNAVETLSSYIKAGNKLIITANARNSELITKLIQKHDKQYSIIDLFALATSAPDNTDELNNLAVAKFIRESK